MRRIRLIPVFMLILLVGLTLCLSAHPNPHFTMIVPGEDLEVTPDDFNAKEGETVNLKILWGHPYEHHLFDAPKAKEVSARLRSPTGELISLDLNETKIEGKRAYETSFKADQLGDYLVLVKLVAKEHGLVDRVKAVIHCGPVQMGWSENTNRKQEIIPLTRPYGLEEGFVFSGRVLYQGEPLSYAKVEVEKYHSKPQAEEVLSLLEERSMPDPDSMITRVTTTDPNGVFSYTLDEAGIWFLGALGPKENGLVQRAVFIVPVRERFPGY